MKSKLLIIALLTVFTVSFIAGDAEARKRKSTSNLKPITAVSATDSQTQAVQQKLAQIGYNPGPADGIVGVQTIEAIEQFQRDNGLDADGILGPATLAALGL